MSANLCLRVQSRLRRLAAADTSLHTISCQITGKEHKLDSCSHTVFVNWVIIGLMLHAHNANSHLHVAQPSNRLQHLDKLQLHSDSKKFAAVAVEHVHHIQQQHLIVLDNLFRQHRVATALHEGIMPAGIWSMHLMVEVEFA